MRSPMLSWIVLALSACAWVLLWPLYTALPTWVGGVFILAATITAIAAANTDGEGSGYRLGPGIRIALLAALGVGAYFVPWGMRMALMLLSGGVVAQGMSGRRGRRLSRGLWTVGTIAAVQGAAAGLYALWLSGMHASPILTAIEGGLLRLFGRTVSAVGETLYVSTASGTISVLPSWDQFGLALGCLVWCGFLVFVLGSPSTPNRVRVAAKGTGVLIATLALRHVLLLLVALETISPHLFWHPAVLAASAVVLVALLARFSGLRPNGLGASIERVLAAPRPALVGIGACTCAGTFLVLGALFLVPAGAPNEGSILFDEGHGDWESTLVPMDTEAYGQITTYNFASLYDWLSYHAPVGQITEPLTAERLDGCAILVLKTPSVAYAKEEIEAVERFVASGGGLFVIGDHTNVFGMTTVLNPILEPFGLAFHYDSTYRLGTGSFTTYVRGPLCFDPIGQHIASFDFLTSCSIDAPLSAYRTIADDRVLSNQADYSTRDFFPRQRYNLASQFGRFTQSAATLHERGRVAVFTDSTCFSNFSVFMDGYPDYLLGTVSFLMRTNVAIPFRVLMLAAGMLAAIGAGLLVLRTGRARGVAAVLCGVMVGWSGFTVTVDLVHRVTYPLPEAAEEMPIVYFDVEYSDIDIEPQPASAASYDLSRQFDTMFVWTQRIARIPLLIDGTEWRDARPEREIVLINPRGDIEPGYLAWLQSYVETGGTAYLLDRCGRDRSGTDRILAAFDRTLDDDACGADRVLDGATVVSREVSPSLTIYASVLDVGEGRLVFVSDSSAFSNVALGGSFTIPSTIQRALYDTVFWLFDEASHPEAIRPESEEDAAEAT